jgi:dihydrodipicolinate synthase/N-acetylneuraminate lyase
MAAVNLVDGLYPVMLTPFTEDGTAVDYDVLRSLTNWYIDSGSAGGI